MIIPECLVERGGRVVARLKDPQFFEMFWDSFQLEILTDDTDEAQRIRSDKSWWLDPLPTFRAIADSNHVYQTFPAGDVFTENGRVILRSFTFR